MSQLQFNLMPNRKVWTVCELTARIRDLLARNFTDIWVTGEISNAREARLYRSWIMLTAMRRLPRWNRGGHTKRGPVRREGFSRSG